MGSHVHTDCPLVGQEPVEGCLHLPGLAAALGHTPGTELSLGSGPAAGVSLGPQPCAHGTHALFFRGCRESAAALYPHCPRAGTEL